MLRTYSMAAIVALFIVAVAAQSASAVQIGLGAGLAGATNNDSAGSRLNIEEATTALSAGGYLVTSFEYFNSSNTSNVQPFLALKTGAQDYTILWVGPTAAAPGSSGIVSIPYLGQMFMAPSGTIVAGFNTAGPAVQFAEPDGPTTTDHNNPANFALVAGATLTGANFTNANLSRNYAFAVNVVQIPEPATAATGLLGLAALAGLRRRRHA